MAEDTQSAGQRQRSRSAPTPSFDPLPGHSPHGLAAHYELADQRRGSRARKLERDRSLVLDRPREPDSAAWSRRKTRRARPRYRWLATAIVSRLSGQKEQSLSTGSQWRSNSWGGMIVKRRISSYDTFCPPESESRHPEYRSLDSVTVTVKNKRNRKRYECVVRLDGISAAPLRESTMNRIASRLLRFLPADRWWMLRVVCALWFAVTSCGIPWEFVGVTAAAQQATSSPGNTATGSRCCCSVTKRQSGTCCCAPRKIATPSLPTTTTQSVRKSCCRPGATVAVHASPKAPAQSLECEIAPCGCGGEEQVVWSGQHESRLIVVNAQILVCCPSQLLSTPADLLNESPRFAPPVPPPIAA